MKGQRERKAALPSSDPFLSYEQAADDPGINLATLVRRVVPAIDVVVISPRRRGIRRSVLEACKEMRTRPASKITVAECQEPDRRLGGSQGARSVDRRVTPDDAVVLHRAVYRWQVSPTTERPGTRAADGAPAARGPRRVQAAQDLAPTVVRLYRHMQEHRGGEFDLGVTVLERDVINSCRIIEDGDKRPWASLPQQQSRDGKWFPIVETIRKELGEEIKAAILGAWLERQESHPTWDAAHARWQGPDEAPF